MKKEDSVPSLQLFVNLKKRVVYYMDCGPLGGPIYGYAFSVVVSKAQSIDFDDFRTTCIDRLKKSFETYSQRAVDDGKFISKEINEEVRKFKRKCKDLLISFHKRENHINIEDKYQNQLQFNPNIANEEFFDQLLKWLEY